jgi:hypothetical protein
MKSQKTSNTGKTWICNHSDETKIAKKMGFESVPACQIELYIGHGLSRFQIGRLFGRHKDSIGARLKKWGIKLRKKGGIPQRNEAAFKKLMDKLTA